jgi:zinc/manganese transport system substrate-binding protein
MRRRLALTLPALAMPLAWTPAGAAAPLAVVASFSILADMVREVAGEAASVVALVGADGDAHVFEPRPQDAQRLARAAVVVVNGLGFEGWIERLVQASGFRGSTVVASRGIVPRRQGRGLDPHAWQSLMHARRYVENIRAALAGALPAQAAAIDLRTAAYVQRIDTLDAELRALFEAVPAPRRRVITSHDAFGYFGEAYGIEFLAPRGWSTASEPSAAQVAKVIRQVREDRASALLVENISDPRLVERIAAETGAAVGGRVYSDALSPPGTQADTYLRMYAHNARVIAGALRDGAAR